MADDEQRFRDFVEGAVGGRVVRLERTALGSSRVTLLVDVAMDDERDGATRKLVLRHDSGDGPLSGTDIDLAHEAQVYRALAEHPVRIPRLVATSDDERTLLVERAAGSEAFGVLPDAERLAVARDYGRALAELHAVPPEKLALDGFARPEAAADHARLELRRWLGYQRRTAEPAPMTRLAGDWLEANAPARVQRSVLCHGDAGAGNFLHDGERVSALLDWEFAHFGDPLDDVAWVLVRSHLLGGEPEMRAGLAVWSERSGLALEPASIAYYRALVLLRMAISCELALGHAKASGAMNSATYELLLPYLGFLLPQALREAGCDDAALAEHERAGQAAIDEVPVLAASAKPLVPWA